MDYDALAKKFGGGAGDPLDAAAAKFGGQPVESPAREVASPVMPTQAGPLKTTKDFFLGGVQAVNDAANSLALSLQPVADALPDDVNDFLVERLGMAPDAASAIKNQHQGYEAETGNSTAAQYGRLTGGAGVALPLGGLRIAQGATILPRIANGGAQGGASALLLSSGSPEAGAIPQATIGTGVGAFVNAVLPPALSGLARRFSPELPPNPVLQDEIPDLATKTVPNAHVLPGATKVASDIDQSIFDSIVRRTEEGYAPLASLREADIRALGVKHPRFGAVSGDASARSKELELSRSWTKSGEAMGELLGEEQAAIRAYSDDIAESTGGTVGAGPEDRGFAVLHALNGVEEWYDSNIRNLYRAADERAQQLGGLSLDGLNKFIADNKSKFMGTTDGTALFSGLRARMQELGILAADDQGRLAPQKVTAAQAESLRQYLNEVWAPRTNGVIKELKNVIDDDVTRAAGEDLYQQARQMRATRARLLDDPKGVSKLLEEAGINRSVPIEKIPDYVARLDNAQLEHIKTTLNSMPTTELSAAGRQAWNEIRASVWQGLVARASQRKGWNAQRFSEELNGIGAKRLQILFTPEEIQRIATLQRAGHHLDLPDRNPSGSASMVMNLVRDSKADLPVIGQAANYGRSLIQGAKDKRLLNSAKQGIAGTRPLPLPMQVPIAPVAGVTFGAGQPFWSREGVSLFE